MINVVYTPVAVLINLIMLALFVVAIPVALVALCVVFVLIKTGVVRHNIKMNVNIKPLPIVLK